MLAPPEYLLMHRSEPEPRAVLEDWHLTAGWRFEIEAPILGDGGGGYGYGYGDGDGGDGGGDGGYGDGGDGGGYGDGDGGYGGGYGDGGYGDGRYGATKEESDMHPGIRIVVLPGGSYVYVLVGWLRRVEGDEYELVGARCIRRFGANRSVAWLAEHGPADDTELLDAAAQPEEIHRLHIRRGLRCSEAAWTKYVPRPDGWVD